MGVNRRSASLVAAVMGALIMAPIQPPIAFGAASASTSNTLTLSSGTVRVFATTVQTYSVTGVNLSTPISNNVNKDFFVNNGGNISVTRFVMTITLPNNSNVSAFRRCALNVSFTGSNTCASGSPVSLSDPVSGSATNYLISLPGPGYYAFQIRQNKTGTLTVATSANVQYHIGVISNS